MVVPARYSILQVAFDLARRFPVIVVSYQPREGKDPLLHVWDGQDWLYLTLDDYRQARFVRVRPARAVLVGDETVLPTELVESSRWCPLVLNIRAMDTAGLINGMGQVLAFRDADWRWFAARYNMPLVDQNAELRKKSWYDRAPEEVLPWLQTQGLVSASTEMELSLPQEEYGSVEGVPVISEEAAVVQPESQPLLLESEEPPIK